MASAPSRGSGIRRRDRALLIGLGCVIVGFAAISITVNALRPDVPTTSNSAPVDPRAQDSDYVLRLGPTVLPDRTQAEAIALGRSVCASFDAARTRADIVDSLKAEHLTSRQAEAVIAAATDAYCPEQRQAPTS